MARRLNDILVEAGIHQIDYISLDVEGAEPEILASFDFDAFDVRAWTIENMEGRNDVAGLMRSPGYERRTQIGADEVYVKR